MIHYLDCGAGFLVPGNSSINPLLFPDELHPNTDGYRVLAACIAPVLNALVLGTLTTDTILFFVFCIMLYLTYVSF